MLSNVLGHLKCVPLQWTWVILVLSVVPPATNWVPPREIALPTAIDPSLLYVAKQETVSDTVMLFLALGIPLICISIISAVQQQQHWLLYVLSLLQSFGMALLLTNTVKKITGICPAVANFPFFTMTGPQWIAGKPRPCFYDMCKWDVTMDKCVAPRELQWKAVESFPSGHASLSFAGASKNTARSLARNLRARLQAGLGFLSFLAFSKFTPKLKRSKVPFQVTRTPHHTPLLRNTNSSRMAGPRARVLHTARPRCVGRRHARV